MRPPDALIFDLDGTLAVSKQPLTPVMGDTIVRLLAHVPVAVMSGAKFDQFETQFFPALPKEAQLLHLYIFPANAAQCYIYQHEAWAATYDHVFTQQEKEVIFVALHNSLQTVGLGEEPAQLWGARIEDRDAQISFSALGQQAPVEEKRAWKERHNALRIRLCDTLAAALPDFSVKMGGITTIDITRKGNTKAYGVEQLSILTNIPITNMLYIGDDLKEGGNDSVVLKTGVPTHAVKDPEDTMALLNSLLELYA